MDKPKIIEFAEYSEDGDGTAFSIRADQGAKHIMGEVEGVLEIDDMNNSTCFPLEKIQWFIDSLTYIKENMDLLHVQEEK